MDSQELDRGMAEWDVSGAVVQLASRAPARSQFDYSKLHSMIMASMLVSTDGCQDVRAGHSTSLWSAHHR